MKLSGKIRWSMNDTLVLMGVGMVFWGLYLWWPPLAWMLVGTFLIIIGITRESSEG